MKNTLRHLLALLVVATMVFGMMPANVVFAAETEETANAAKIGDIEYPTLAEAVKAVEKGAGETVITLQNDQTISGQMIGHQYVQNIVLDLNGYTLSSNGVTLTSYRNGTSLTVKNGTVSGNSTSGTLRGTYGGKIILGDNLTVQGAGGSATLVYLDNGQMEISAENGVQFVGGKLDFKQSANVNNKLNVAASIDRTYFGTLAAAIDVGDVVTLEADGQTATVSKAVTMIKNGHTATITAGNGFEVEETDDAYTVVAAKESVAENEEIGHEPLVDVVARIGETGYGTLFAAIDAAQNGETIVLQKDITMENTVLTISKDITIDFNGNTVTGIFKTETDLPQGNGVQPTVPPQFVLIKDGANVTLQESTGEGGLHAETGELCLNNLIRVESQGKLVIKNGNYSQDFSVVGAGMIDTRGSDNILVQGGNFCLGNVGTLSNGSPWIFNASGQNSRHINVTGGTFNADIQHQYYPFEVNFPKDLALKNENGVYTVVPAVAYVTEREWSSAWYTNEVGYATLEEAIAACEGPKTVGNKTSEQEVVVLLKEPANNATITINKPVVLDLNGKTISSTANPAILVESAEVIVKNGGINLTAFGTGTSSVPSVAVKVKGGAALTIYDAAITATDADNGTVVGVLSEKTSELMLIRTSVLVSAEESLFNVGVRSYGVATLEECSVIAESDYTANAAGTNYASSSYGIASESDLTLLNCYVWGAHSGVRALGSVYVDGGTYEGYGHGAMYLAGAGTTSYLYNAAFNWAEMRSGTFADSVAGTNNAAFYIGGKSNITAYFDGCSFKSNNVSPSYCIVLRSSSGESNNSAYVSNSTFSNYNHSAYRVSNTTNTTNLYAYSGVGNTYLGSGKVFNYTNKGFYTEESYAQDTTAQ